MSALIALRRSGRFMVMVSKPWSSCCRTISFALMCVAFVAIVICHSGARVSANPESRDSGSGASAPSRNDGLRPSLLHHRAARGLQRLERLVAGHGREQPVVVPAALGF